MRKTKYKLREKENIIEKKLPLILNAKFLRPDGKCVLFLNKPIKINDKSTGNLHKHLKVSQYSFIYMYVYVQLRQKNSTNV